MITEGDGEDRTPQRQKPGDDKGRCGGGSSREPLEGELQGNKRKLEG